MCAGTAGTRAPRIGHRAGGYTSDRLLPASAMAEFLESVLAIRPGLGEFGSSGEEVARHCDRYHQHFHLTSILSRA